jgi:RecB family exonuclease
VLDNKDTIELTGKIDKIEYLGNDFSGEVNLIDYKTGHPFSEKTKGDKENYERQIVFYHLLLEESDDGNLRINKSVLDFLEKNKKGEFEQYTFQVEKDHLNNLKKEINDCANEVLSMEFLKKGCGKKDCEWCQM